MTRRGKRGNDEGSVFQRKDGRWVAQLQVGFGSNGAPKFRHRYAETRKEADERLVEMKSAKLTGMLPDAEKLTVARFLERWLEAKARDIRPGTLKSYRNTARLHIAPQLGKIKLERLRPLDLERMVSGLLEAGRSPMIAAYALRVAKMALKQAVLWQLVPRNVAEAVRPPKQPRHEMRVWTLGEASKFLETARGHRLYALFAVALLTGLRRGELLGLRWQDLDVEGRRLTVRHALVEIEGGVALAEPKTRASRRTIALAPSTMALLEAHRFTVNANQNRHVDDADFVFSSTVGTPTHPRNLEAFFHALVRQSGVTRIRFHDLRHTAASLMIRKGVAPKTVSELLGHTNVAFTLHVYTHLYDDQRLEAALDLDDFGP